MNLSNLLGFNQNQSSVGSAPVNGGGTVSTTMPSADTSGMKAGQTIQGEVVAVKGNEVTLQLDNGSQVSARVEQGMQIGVGQTMTFEVKSNSGSRLALS
ncbi:MAG: hypothetical protein LBV33_09165, partial [Lachnospiraceae bacterium]|nr:hypothetical protein [Lachnospiraceae bacterium]